MRIGVVNPIDSLARLSVRTQDCRLERVEQIVRLIRQLPALAAIFQEIAMESMPVVNARCCGLDVHKETVVACVRRLGPDGKVDHQVRTFTTTTRGLLELGDWLAREGVTSAAMESNTFLYIGNTTSAVELLGVFGASPVASHLPRGRQRDSPRQTGSAVLPGSTFTGGTGSTAYTIGDLVLAPKSMG